MTTHQRIKIRPGGKLKRKFYGLMVIRNEWKLVAINGTLMMELSLSIVNDGIKTLVMVKTK